MISVIHYHWRAKDQRKSEEGFRHEGVLGGCAVHRVAAARVHGKSAGIFKIAKDYVRVFMSLMYETSCKC